MTSITVGLAKSVIAQFATCVKLNLVVLQLGLVQSVAVWWVPIVMQSVRLISYMVLFSSVLVEIAVHILLNLCNSFSINQIEPLSLSCSLSSFSFACLIFFCTSTHLFIICLEFIFHLHSTSSSNCREREREENREETWEENWDKLRVRVKKEKERWNHEKIVRQLELVWYMCLKTENCCLKTFVKIRVGEKVCGNTWNVV